MIQRPKSGPNVVRVSKFWLQNVLRTRQSSAFAICFAPQQRSLFRHLNFPQVLREWYFEHFDFEMCFAPQGRLLSQLQKVLRTWCVLYILTRALKLSSFLKAEGNSLAGFARLHSQPKQSRRCMKMSQSHCLSSSLETKAHPPRQQNTALYQQESEQGRPRYFPSSMCDSWGGGYPTTKQ